MRRALCFAGLQLALIAGLLAGDEQSPLNFDTVFTVSKSVSKNESGEFGLMNGGILLKDGRPEACFDLALARNKKPELVYLILFQPEKLPQKINVSMNVKTDGNESRGKYSLEVADKPLSVSYSYKFDSESGEYKERDIKLIDRKWKPDGPRVFLADASGEKLVLTPVDVKLPAAIPSPAAEDVKAAMRQLVADLAKESKPIRDFLQISKSQK